MSYISRKQTEDAIRKYADQKHSNGEQIEYINGILKAISVINEQPAADVVKSPLWIDVDDELPEMYERVLVNYTYEGGFDKTICAKFIGGKHGWVIEDDKEGWCKITHWQPLPESPSKTNGGKK